MKSNYCICCGKEIPEGNLVCGDCYSGQTKQISKKEKEIREKLCDIIKDAATPIEYGGGLYNAPEVYIPTEEDILNALLASGLIKLNLEG